MLQHFPQGAKIFIKEGEIDIFLKIWEKLEQVTQLTGVFHQMLAK
jgi:hypothetical protein